MNNTIITQEFQQVQGIISLHRSRALQVVNNQNLLTAWEIGAFVSNKLKNCAWGSKTVLQLAEYLKIQDPTLRGYSRSNIYNMVFFYESYSSLDFVDYNNKYKLNEIVQTLSGQLGELEFVQTLSGQLREVEFVQSETSQIVQTVSAQFPNFLNLTTLSNHFEILNTCKTIEEKIFYIIYSHKETLNNRELKRCLKNNTFASIMGDKHNLSKGLKNIYPQITPMLKDTLFLDFLGLPKKHSEKRLKNSILDNMNIN